MHINKLKKSKKKKTRDFYVNHNKVGKSVFIYVQNMFITNIFSLLICLNNKYLYLIMWLVCYYICKLI